MTTRPSLLCSDAKMAEFWSHKSIVLTSMRATRRPSCNEPVIVEPLSWRQLLWRLLCVAVSQVPSETLSYAAEEELSLQLHIKTAPQTPNLKPLLAAPRVRRPMIAPSRSATGDCRKGGSHCSEPHSMPVSAAPARRFWVASSKTGDRSVGEYKGPRSEPGQVVHCRGATQSTNRMIFVGGTGSGGADKLSRSQIHADSNL